MPWSSAGYEEAEVKMLNPLALASDSAHSIGLHFGVKLEPQSNIVHDLDRWISEI